MQIVKGTMKITGLKMTSRDIQAHSDIDNVFQKYTYLKTPQYVQKPFSHGSIAFSSDNPVLSLLSNVCVSGLGHCHTCQVNYMYKGGVKN